MQATNNVPRSAPNGQDSIHSPIDFRIKVKTTTDTKARMLGVIIPKDTIGKVLAYDSQCNVLIVDFGLLPVISIPANSHLIEILGVRHAT